MNLFSDRTSIGTHQYNSLWRMLFFLLLVGATPVFIWAVMTQRIELRKRAATSETVVCWNRVGGTAPNLYWPNGCKGNPTPQMCTQATVPLTATETYGYNAWVTEGKQYIPGCGMTPPNTTSINWKTQYVYLLASDMVISANGKIFKGAPSGPATVHSNPASATYTTLESTWIENGVEMRMYIYFDASACTKSLPPQCNWRITELRIYNGNAQGDWIYFKGGDTLSVGARVGAEYSNPKLILTSSENGIGKVEFTNLRLNAFTNQVAITPPISTCTNQRNGASCTIGQCPTCPPGRACPAIACKLQSGTCQNGQCIPSPTPTAIPTCGGIAGRICPDGYSCMYSNGTSRPSYPDESGKCVLPQKELNCNLLSTSSSSYFTSCASQGYSGVCFNKYSGEYQGCTKTGSNDCTQNNMNASLNILCPAINTPTPTCIPRPSCMDPLPGQPQCMFDLAPGSWLCPQTPTPSVSCKTGLNTFSVGAACPNAAGQFLSAKYSCHDGVTGSVGSTSTCQTSLALANLAQQACLGHSSCSTTPPSCIPLPECVYNPPIVNGRPVLCSIPPPPNGQKYCPRPTVTPTGTKKPGDFNGDGKVNILDYNVVLNNFGKSGPVGFSPADLNADGKVNLLDYNMLLNYFGK